MTLAEFPISGSLNLAFVMIFLEFDDRDQFDFWRQIQLCIIYKINFQKTCVMRIVSLSLKSN